ncbi:DnaB-like helicase C-terminal domain-containing protein [Colidextribacter sp. OB.20]|uniref:DnaB-like helicase C-terminal domain-containing protein n=1 Tax=Colidextribacter sp. OB.20 TaxID=2304568 RepID=UPI0013698433
MDSAEVAAYGRNIWAEQSVIGSMLIDPRVVGLVMAGLTEDDFLLEADQRLFRSFKARFVANQPIDSVLVCQAAAPGDKELNAYAIQLMDLTPTAANVAEYIEVVKENTRMTKSHSIGREIAASLTQEESVRLYQQGLDLLSNRGRDDEADMAKAAVEFNDFLERTPDYLPWGFPLLDEGLDVSPGILVVLGGRPSDGKTALALHMAYAQAETKNVGYFTLEDDRNTLFSRLKASISGVPLRNILRRKLNERDYRLLADVNDEIVKRRLTIIDAAGMTVNDIITRTHAKKFDVIYVDYLQMIRSSLRGRGTRQDEVADISRSLADMARNSGVVVVALAQLSRPAQKGKREAPLMADLKESGQIEQDANVILFVWREDETDSKTPRHLTLAKNKLGLLGQWGITFNGPTQKFLPELTTDRPVAKRREPEYKQQTFYELPGGEPLPWEEEYDHIGAAPNT